MTAKALGSFTALMCHRWVTVKLKPVLVRRASYAALLPSQQLLWVRLNWWPRRARLDEMSDVCVCVWNRVFNPCPGSYWTPSYTHLSARVCLFAHVCVFTVFVNSLSGYSTLALVWKWVLREKYILTAFLQQLSVLEVSCLIMNQFQAYAFKFPHLSLSRYLLFVL